MRPFSLVGATSRRKNVGFQKRKGTHWHYYFRLRGVRYRGSTPRRALKGRVKFFRNVVIASRRGKEIENKKADEFVFVNPNSKKPYTDVKRAFGTACDLAELRNLEWHDLRATFCTRLAMAGYDGFTIKALMGHRDMKTTGDISEPIDSHVRLLWLNKLAINEIRPPMLVAVNS